MLGPVVAVEEVLARVDLRNTTRYWNDPRMAGLSCLCADFTAHDYAPHSHDALVVAVTETGGSEFKSRGEIGEATVSLLLAFNPDEPHSGRMARSERWRYRGLYLTQSALGTLTAMLGIDAVPYFTANGIGDGELIAAFLDLHQTLQAGDALLARERLVGSFGRLFRRHGSEGKRIPIASQDRGAVSKVQALIHDRYREQLTLEAMGHIVDLTPFQLIGLFKRAIGLTPHTYLTQVRLKVAIRAMRGGSCLAEAALLAGFYDQSALTNHFKRAYGITPRQWVRAGA
jgi:AraC-like DNA-binding protein